MPAPDDTHDDPAAPPTPTFAPWSRTGLVLLAAMAFSLILGAIPKPWGEGQILDPTPDLTGLGQGGPLPPAPASEGEEEVATVDLTAPAGDDTDSAQDPDQAMLAALDALVEELGPPSVELERPCLEEVEGVCKKRAMDAFFERLHAVASKRAERPVRWTQLGDSMTAWVDAPTRFRTLMQAQFGDGGIGVILPTDPGHARELQSVARTSAGWSVRTAPFLEDPHFGLSGSVFRGGMTTVRTPGPVDRIGVLSGGPGTAQVRAGEVELQLDLQVGLTPARIDPATELVFQGFDADTPIAGLLLERVGPGVIVDNLGVVSMRADQLLKVDDALWVQQARAIEPDVLVYSYGAKSPHEAAWHRKPPPEDWIQAYEADYSRVLERGRRVDADCLVLSLMTRAEPDGSGKRFTVFASVAPTVQAQRRAALAHGCAFYDSYAAIGGPDGAHDWYWHEPRLLGFDLLHLTPEGYKRYGTDLYVSLVHAFRDWLAERAVR